MTSPIAFDRPVTLILIPIMLTYFWWVARRSYAGLNPQTARLALAGRLIVATCLILAISGMHVVKRTNRLTTLFLVDVSKSIRPDQRARGLEFLRKALASKRSDDSAGIIVFGRTSYLSDPPSTAVSDLGDIHASVAGDATNMEEALRLAESSFPSDRGRKIVIISDGNENSGDTAGEIDNLRQQGTRVDVVSTILPVGKNDSIPSEALVESVVVPTTARKSAPFPLRVIVSSTVAQNAKLTLTQDGHPIATQKVSLRAGKNAYDFQQTLDQTGFHRYDATLQPDVDSIQENNQAYGYVSVQGRPRVLYVAEPDNPGAASLRRTLAAQKIDLDVQAPGQAPTTVAALASYDSVLLSDVGADEVGPSGMAAIEEATRDFGVGLGMLGGPHSYGAGGYTGTPIEAALPVSMEIKDRKRIPPAAIALVIEDLEEQTSVNWSIVAAKAAVDLLEPQDQVGVLDCNGVWRIQLQKIGGNKKAIEAAMDSLGGMNDPPSYEPYVSQAASTLAASGAPIRHIIFFGDGDAEMESGSFADTLKKIHKQGITVSTIASGADDRGIQFLKDIATFGGGKSYVAEKATDLPGLLLRDQQMATKQYIEEKPFRVAADPSDDVAGGIDWPASPPLLGYNITSRKPGADTALTAPGDNDPVFAHWRYGLGRTFAFTSDDRPHWAVQWLPWEGYTRFWAQAVRWSLRSNTNANFQSTVDNESGKGHVVVDAFSQSNGFINGAAMNARVVAPDQSVHPVTLQQTAPGRYEGTFDTDQTGAYMVNVRQGDAAPGSHATPPTQTVGLVVPYSAEYRTLSPNLPLLTRLAESTGGQFQSDPERIFRDAPLWVTGAVDLAPLLLGLTAFMFLLDIAVRKLALRPDKVREAATHGIEATQAKVADYRAAKVRAADPTPQMERLLARKTMTRVNEDDRPGHNTTERLLNRKASARVQSDGDNPFPQVASLDRKPKPGSGAPPPNDAGYTNRLLEAKRRAKDRDE